MNALVCTRCHAVDSPSKGKPEKCTVCGGAMERWDDARIRQELSMAEWRKRIKVEAKP